LSAQTSRVPSKVSKAEDAITPLLWRSYNKCQTSVSWGTQSYFSGYLAIQACLAWNLKSEWALLSGIHFHHIILFSWQDEWTATQNNKLRSVETSIKVWQSSFSSEQFQVGHFCMTHVFVTRWPGTSVCALWSALYFTYTSGIPQ
jgi:hypothetical protein